MTVKPVVYLPGDLWRLVLSYVPFDDRLTLLRLLSVNKAMFAMLEPQCWQFLYHLSQVMPPHPSQRTLCIKQTPNGYDVAMENSDRKNGRLYLPRLVQHMAQDSRYFTRESLSFLLAAVLHEPMRGHRIEYDRYDSIEAQRPLRDLYRFQPGDQSLVTLDRDPDVKVYELPAGTHVRQPSEVERIALEHCDESDRRYAVFYAIARDQLVLRDPLPSDPLYRVVLRGEHIFSEARAIDLGALFCYRAKRGAELVRVMDLVQMNVERAQLYAVNAVRERLNDNSDDGHSEDQHHHEVYHYSQDNGALFNRLFAAPRKQKQQQTVTITDGGGDSDDEGEACNRMEEDDDDDTTLDSDMFSDETADPFTDDTVSCDVASTSPGGGGAESDESCSVTLNSDDDPDEEEEGDEEEEDDNYTLDSDTDDEIGATSSSRSSDDEDERSAELVPMRKIIDCS